MEMPCELAEFLRAQMAWSRKTFGPGLRTIGILRHIEKELREISDAPTDQMEWIDAMLLAMDGYWRAGGEPEMLLTLMRQKQRRNFAREWPPVQPEDQPCEHVRSTE